MNLADNDDFLFGDTIKIEYPNTNFLSRSTK